MKLILVASLFALSCNDQEVTINKDGSITLTLSKQEAEHCKKSGGCLLIPLDELEAVMREAAKNMCVRKWTI